MEISKCKNCKYLQVSSIPTCAYLRKNIYIIDSCFEFENPIWFSDWCKGHEILEKDLFKKIEKSNSQYLYNFYDLTCNPHLNVVIKISNVYKNQYALSIKVNGIYESCFVYPGIFMALKDCNKIIKNSQTEYGPAYRNWIY